MKKRIYIIGAIVIALIAIGCFIFLPTEGKKSSEARELKQKEELINQEQTEDVCGNVSEKCTSFNGEFDKALINNDLETAEQIASYARAYRSSLNGSKLEEFEKMATPYDAIIAAKKFNLKFLSITGGESYFLATIGKEEMPLVIDLKNEITVYREKLEEKALKAFDENIDDIECKIVEAKAFSQGWDYCMAFEARDKQKMKKIKAAIQNSIKSTNQKYQKIYKNNVEIAKLSYLKNLHNYVDNGTITESEFSILKKAVLED
ncbi:MAG: hypothetical protein ACI31A_05760 [Candidatus Limisoma sp.]